MYNSVMQRTKGSNIGLPNPAKQQFVKDIRTETPLSDVYNNFYDLVDNSFIDRGGEDEDDD